MKCAGINNNKTSRFIINYPDNELTFTRLFFQIEEAFWFYEDIYRIQKGLKSFDFKEFSEQIFFHLDALQDFRGETYTKELEKFYEYKRSIPVCGAIILNQDQDKILLVKGYNVNSWGFPRGKINKNETFEECAKR
jgi:mRNA-decapping enzyme subunit 2